MAVFTVATDDNGNRKYYKGEGDLFGVLNYTLKKSLYTEYISLIPGDATVVKNQFLYLQNCRGKELTTRALHFVLAYDSYGWEKHMDLNKVIASSNILHMLWRMFGLEKYQAIFAVHDNGETIHYHLIINPVDPDTYNILNYGIGELNAFLKEMATMLYSLYRVALVGVSYFDERGRFKFGSGHSLYENREFPWSNF